MKTGLIDAAENNIPSYDTASSMYEAVKFYSQALSTPWRRRLLLMSKSGLGRDCPRLSRTWCARPPKNLSRCQRQKWDEQEAKSLDVVLKAGSTIVTDVDKASFRAVMPPVYAKFINTPDLQRLVKQVQDNK